MTTDWLQVDRERCWHPYTQHGLDTSLLPVVGAQGAWLELADGRRLLDGISSWWSILHGHCHPAIVAAISEQAAQLDHVLFAGCTHEKAASVAASLVELAAPLRQEGRSPLGRVFYSDNGSSAVEVALKAAYLAWVRRGEPQRTVFIALEGSYHGDTVGAMSVSEPAPFFQEFGPLLFEVVRVRPDADQLAEVMAQHEGRVAGMIVEPLVQGAAGMVMYPAQFLQDARQQCDQHGAFLIADEVFTGFGRTGRVFACEHAGVQPDLLCLAKGLTGGTLPLAATVATDEIFEAFRSEERGKMFFHGHTFTANPIACAAAVASIELIRSERTESKLDHIGAQIYEQLAPLKDAPYVADLRRLGSIVAVQLASPDEGYYSNIGERFRAVIPTQDVLLRPSGNVLYTVPPACVSQDEATHIADVMATVCQQVSAG